jgi:hypothetical protein
MKHSEAHWEWVWMSLIGLFVCLPLSLTIYSRRPKPPPWLAWLHERNLKIAGWQATERPVELTSRNVLNGTYQRGRALGFDREFIPRGVFIRLTCELYFRLFHTSPLKFADELVRAEARTSARRGADVIVGREGWLYQGWYLQEYHLNRPSRSRVGSWVKKLQDLQQECQKRGIAFAFVVTPSKPSVYPEYIPPAWQARYDERPRSYDHLMDLLRRRKIPYVDGHALTMAAKNGAPAPVFPKGGIHWGAYPAWVTSSALVETLRQQGKPLFPLQYENLRVRDVPMDANAATDADVYNLMNLAIPWRYPVTQVTIKRMPVKEDAKPTVALVGGSFARDLASQLSASGQFSEINHYFYYTFYKSTYFEGGWRVVASPVKSIDVERELFGADCLIVELNETLALYPRYMNLLFDDTLEARSHLDSRPSEPKPRFRYETYKEYEFGTDIWLKTESAAAITPYLTGFFPPEPTGTWTNGTEATIRLVVPPPGADLVLDADVLTFGGTEQYAEVFANETPVGKWRFPTMPAGQQRAVIPKEAIGSTRRLVLRFVIAEPRSMRQMGAAPDDRPIGLAFSRIRLSVAGGK